MAVSLVTQYDIMVFQGIEKALGVKLKELEGVEKTEVMVLSERVAESQRVAVRELRDMQDKVKGRGRKNGSSFHGQGKRRRDDMDQEEG